MSSNQDFPTWLSVAQLSWLRLLLASGCSPSFAARRSSRSHAGPRPTFATAARASSFFSSYLNLWAIYTVEKVLKNNYCAAVDEDPELLRKKLVLTSSLYCSTSLFYVIHFFSRKLHIIILDQTYATRKADVFSTRMRRSLSYADTIGTTPTFYFGTRKFIIESADRIIHIFTY